ncbi:hypothetical protein AA0113_g9254 [Alternaria arborescens]|uniref:Uncharacterized protein n=1 Tax=Alternaria arborescens TaxID=156630 RepID=A0A4V1X2Z4_9PLEO|nr:hypothetical protein AA0113_g9254 [Alternaria arborescens]
MDIPMLVMPVERVQFENVEAVPGFPTAMVYLTVVFDQMGDGLPCFVSSIVRILSLHDLPKAIDPAIRYD